MGCVHPIVCSAVAHGALKVIIIIIIILILIIIIIIIIIIIYIIMGTYVQCSTY